MNGIDMKTKIKDELTDLFELRLNQRLQLFENLVREQTRKGDERNIVINQMHEKLSLIEKTGNDTYNQAVRTNGRVSTHDKLIAGFKGWITGVGVCLSVILALVSVIFYTEIGGVKGDMDSLKNMLTIHVNAQER